jgi:predicted HicB family RNase H-like nuclease
MNGMSSTSSAKTQQPNVLAYKNFKAELRFDQDSEFLVAKLIGVPRLFRARNRQAAEEEFQRIVDQELIGKLSSAEEVLLDKEHSGNIALRMGSLLHQDLALAAQRSGKSLNAYIEEKLQTALEVEAIRARQIEPLPKDKVVPFAVHQLLEDEEAASRLFQEIKPYLEERINIFQFPSALKSFLGSFGASLEEIKPYIKTERLYKFAQVVSGLLQEFSDPVLSLSEDHIDSTSDKPKR